MYHVPQNNTVAILNNLSVCSLSFPSQPFLLSPLVLCFLFCRLFFSSLYQIPFEISTYFSSVNLKNFCTVHAFNHPITVFHSSPHEYKPECSRDSVEWVMHPKPQQCNIPRPKTHCCVITGCWRALRFLLCAPSALLCEDQTSH